MKKLMILSALALALSAPAMANVYIKATNGQIVEVTEAELDKANRSAGLSCTSEPAPAPQPTGCQPVYQDMRGYAVMMGDTQLTDFFPNHLGVIAAYQKLVLRGTCTNTKLDCDLTMNGYNNNYVTINGKMASSWGNDRVILDVFNAYRGANICK